MYSFRSRPFSSPCYPVYCYLSSPTNYLAQKGVLRCEASPLCLRSVSRSFHSYDALLHESVTRPKAGSGIKIHFNDAKGQLIKTVEANEGDDILSVAHEHDIDLEGACEGSVACSTCHVIISPEHYNLLPEPEDDENDMLDMAFGLTDTSRLGCQVKLTQELDGMTATLPAATRNMFVDGKKPTHH
ncbi:ferredoxin [Dentipellis sp. KUC8613]|nr:ferredoxin [Dentipellis sp. KUC8613]